MSSPSKDSLPFLLRPLARLAPAALRDQVVADILEEAARLRERSGVVASHAWTLRQLLDPRFLRLRRELRRPPDPRPLTTMNEDTPWRSGAALDSLATEIRVAFRSLRRNPAFTAVAVLTLALGVGATTAVFGVLDGVLLRSLPYAEPTRLLSLQWEGGGQEAGTPVAHALDLDRALADVGEVAWLVRPAIADEIVMTGDSGAERLDGVWVSADLFRVLGVQMHSGPGFAEEADRPGSSDVAVLSHTTWRDRFGGRSEAIGESIRINGRAHEIVGVLPPEFELPVRGSVIEIWLPFSLGPMYVEDRHTWALDLITRPAAGIRTERLAAEARDAAEELSRAYPEDWSGFTLRATPLRDRLLGPARDGLVLLFAAAAAVLLVACSNLAHLLLARTAERRRELAIRLALGAGALRVARPLLIESCLLGLAGGGLGLAGSLWLSRLLLAQSPVPLPRDVAPALDARMALFTIGVSLLAGILFALLPGLRAARIGRAAIRSRGADGGADDHRFRGLLVAAETALVLVLLVAASLSLSSLRTLLDVDPGFSTDGRVTMTLNLPPDRYRDPGNLNPFVHALERRLPALPHVRAAGLVSHLPLGTDSWSGHLFVEGRPASASAERPVSDWEMASPGYFEAAGIPLLRGRTFEASDEPDSASVTIVNETLARELFPDGDALGRRISDTSEEGPWRTIVGIVADVRQQSLAVTPRPYMYLPTTQIFAWPRHELVAWVEGEPTAALATIQDALREMEPDVALSDARPLARVVSRAVATPRFRMLLLGAFGLVATGLGAVGIYGVVAYAMSRRTREFGVRMALGALPEALVRRATLQGMRPVAAGMLLGLLGGVGVGRVMASRLHGIQAVEPTALLFAVAFLALVAWLAAWSPARRAARVDPVSSLRSE